MTKKILALAIMFAMLGSAVLSGCAASSPDSTPSTPAVPQASSAATTPTTVPATTQPDQDVAALKTLVSNMHCSTILVEDLSIESQYEAELDLTVTEYTDSSVSLECALALTDDFWFDFAHSGNTFTVQHEELALPYYCAKAHIYQSGLGGYAPFDFAVDTEKGYMIFKESSNRISYYVVASSDPGVDPLQIAEHFSIFFQIYDHTHIDTGIRTNIYFDLCGTWISESGEIQGPMPFYINGKLPEEYEDGNTVEMELNFIWPKSFGYRNAGAMTYTVTVDVFEKDDVHTNFHGTGTLYDSETNEQIRFAYNIFPMDSTVIIYVNGQYLIGIPRVITQIDSRLNYFKEFLFTTP